MVRITALCGLEIVDVEELPTHGGSLRLWIAHQGTHGISASVNRILALESTVGLETLEAYQSLQMCAENTKHKLLEFLLNAKHQGHRVFGYGAAAKGNTLLNYAGIQADLLPAVADAAPSKQGKLLPGSHIPIISTDELAHENPDSLFVLPWNLIEELRKQMPTRDLVTAIPVLRRWPAKE